MAGKIKTTIDKIVHENAKGNMLIEEMTKTKIIMKGINPRLYTESTEDDPAVLEKLYDLAKNLGLKLS